MANSNLVDHQTNTGAMLNLAYNPSAMDRFKSQKNEDESPVAGGRRPDWIDNPPEGMRVSKGTSKSMGLAKQKAGAGGTQTHTEADNGVYTVYVLIPAPGRPEEPLQDTEDTDIGLGDYDPPELEIDLEDLAPEEEEEIVTDPLSDPQSQGLQGEIQDRQQVEDEVEDDFSNRRQQFLKTQGAGQDSVLAPDPNSLESQLLEQSTKAKGQSAVTSAEPEAYTPRKPLLERFAPDLFGNLNRSAADDVTGNIAEAVDPSKFSAGGLSREEYYQRSIDQAQGRVGRGMFGFGNDGQDDVDRAQERSDRFRFYEEEPTEDESASAGVPRVSQNPPAPSASDLMRASAENTVGLGAATPPDVEEILRPQNKFTPQEQLDTPDDVDAMGMDLEGMAPPEKAGLLSRLGGFAQNNPELLAQIAQAGGGFMQNIAQGRAQKKADAKTRGAMAQSNLIGALTGGKSRPAVMREEAEQGGLLARLGQAVEIGGSVAGGEMKRRTALSQRGEEMDLKGRKVAAGERQGDLMSKRLGIMQDKINKEYEINNKAAQVALAEATGASYERVQGGIESLNKATNIYKGGGYLDPTQGAKNLYGQMRVLYNDYDKDATPANVGAIFQVYQRFFDPATVREGDLKILQEAEGTFRRIQARAERLVGAGGSLSSDTVEEMKRITDKVHSMQARKATEDVNAYISTALDPRDREATSEYYDRIFKMPSLSDSGDKGDLVKDLGQTEIKL